MMAFKLLPTPQAITEDDVERLCVCLRVLCERCEVVGGVFGEKSRQVLAHMISLTNKDSEKVITRIYSNTT